MEKEEKMRGKPSEILKKLKCKENNIFQLKRKIFQEKREDPKKIDKFRNTQEKSQQKIRKEMKNSQKEKNVQENLRNYK